MVSDGKDGAAFENNDDDDEFVPKPKPPVPKTDKDGKKKTIKIGSIKTKTLDDAPPPPVIYHRRKTNDEEGERKVKTKSRFADFPRCGFISYH